MQLRKANLDYNGTTIFKDLDLNIKPNCITALLGPSGVGKTSLLKILADSNDTAYLAQQDLLLPWFTAFDNATLQLKLQSHSKKQKHILHQKAHALFSEVGLSNQQKKFPHELSLGMRQRVALIRTLLQEKENILMDEPFAALDAITRFELQNLCTQFLKNKTVLLVTHDPLEALRMADEIYVLAGAPATFIRHLKLESTPPRDPENSEVMQYQALLFHALMEAKTMGTL